MLLKTRPFYFAPSGSGADAADDDPGEITDAELGSSVATEGEDPTDGDAGPADEPPDLGEIFKRHNLNLPSDPKELDRIYREGDAARKQNAELQQRMNWLLYQQSQQQAAEQQRAAQAQQQQQKPKKIFDLPDYDPKWTELVTRDENGNLVAIPGAPPDIPSRIKAYAAAREEAMNRLLADPLGVMAPHFEPIIQEKAAAIAQQISAQQRHYDSLRRFEAENREWVFQADGHTLTPAANLWNQFHQEALRYGVPNPIEYATDRFDAHLYRMNLQKQANEREPAREDERTAFLEAAARKTNRGGTLPKRTRPTPAQNSKDLWNGLRKQLQALPAEDFE